MTAEEMIFPLCGLTYADVVEVARTSPNKRVAARKLGVSERQFYAVINDKGLGHLFDNRKPRARCVSKDDILAAAETAANRADAADILGVSETYLKDLIHAFGLQGLFHRTIADRNVLVRFAQRGYTRKEAAEALSITHKQALHAIHKHGINHLFPKNGGEARHWAGNR